MCHRFINSNFRVLGLKCLTAYSYLISFVLFPWSFSRDLILDIQLAVPVRALPADLYIYIFVYFSLSVVHDLILDIRTHFSL